MSWKWSENDLTNELSLLDANGDVLLSTGWIFLGDGSPGVYPVPRIARAIEAVPDLVHACQAALDVLSGKVTDPVEPGAPSGAAMNLLAAVLRKVDGE